MNGGGRERLKSWDWRARFRRWGCLCSSIVTDIARGNEYRVDESLAFLFYGKNTGIPLW